MTSAHPYSGLPQPAADALALSARLDTLIRENIAAAGGWISFARYMELALYEPGLGYYSAGSRKLGAAGDFITAPELSPLFGRVLARQIAPLVGAGIDDIIELGAGSGALAAALLAELAALDRLPRQYRILEVSADLRERQQARLAAAVPAQLPRLQWLDRLPERLDAVVIGNEVLDALPVQRIRVVDGRAQELGVTLDRNNRYAWDCRPAFPALAAAVPELPEAYETEIGLAAQALIADLGQRLQRGLLLFFDYGFPAQEFFHPQRDRGTLMCHYRHHAHGDPFLWPGLQDITAHVDFSAIARAAPQLELCGYASQAQFLVNGGITELLAEVPANDVPRYAPLAAQAQKLLSPAEMGELFKVIALGKNPPAPLQVFRRGDRSHTL